MAKAVPFLRVASFSSLGELSPKAGLDWPLLGGSQVSKARPHGMPGQAVGAPFSCPVFGGRIRPGFGLRGGRGCCVTVAIDHPGVLPRLALAKGKCRNSRTSFRPVLQAARPCKNGKLRRSGRPGFLCGFAAWNCTSMSSSASISASSYSSCPGMRLCGQTINFSTTSRVWPHFSCMEPCAGWYQASGC
jgi:hypothetical protein